MSQPIIFNINDIERLRNELRLANEYAEGLESQVEYLEDRVRYERSPSWYNQQLGHSPQCSCVVWPRGAHPCNCGLITE